MTSSDCTAQLHEIYVVLCRAGLNKEYYGRMLGRYQRSNTWMEIAIAAGATGSGLSGISKTEWGQSLWPILTAISVLLALSKPFIQLSHRIQRSSKLFAEYNELYINLMLLVSKIKRRRELTDAVINEFEVMEKRFVQLAKEDDPWPNARVQRACENRIRTRHAVSTLWYPEAAQANGGREAHDSMADMPPDPDLSAESPSQPASPHPRTAPARG